MVDLIHNTSREVYEVKKAALIQGEEIVAKQVGDGKDMMTVLRKCLFLAFFFLLLRVTHPFSVRVNASAKESDRLPESEVYGQMTYVYRRQTLFITDRKRPFHSTLTFAAHDTTSSALARMLHVLAIHQDAQSMLRNEVTAARLERGDLSYNDLMTLPYLDAVVRETLRL